MLNLTRDKIEGKQRRGEGKTAACDHNLSTRSLRVQKNILLYELSWRVKAVKKK